MPNIYKPRYKICYQTKNKVWIYKNSRLRNFYNIRNKIALEKRSWKVNNTLVTKNMKWTVARRLMVPYVKTRTYFSYNYKNTFYLKQQLKHFYGKLKEHHLRTIFKSTWNKEQSFRKDIFVSSLEQRLDMVVFRMRLLPTIFSCHQFIDHQGVLVNNQLVSIPGYKVKLGDIVSLKKNVWSIFYERILYKLERRYFGNSILSFRKQYLLNKMEYLVMLKYHHFYIKILKQVFYNKNYYTVLRRHLQNQQQILNSFETKDSELIKLAEKNKEFFQVLNLILYKKIYFQIKKITLKNLRKLANNQLDDEYYKNFNLILTKNYNTSKLCNLFSFILYQQFWNWHIQKTIIEIKNSKDLNKNQKIKLILWLNNEKVNRINNEFIEYNKKQNFLLKIFRFSVKQIYNKFLNLRYNSIINNNHINNKTILNLIIKLRNQKKRQKFFANRSFKHHWYTPSYLEVDYKTLRAAFIYHPKANEVYYGFPCSFDKIISFYKERAL